jgi:hypothetical protein
MEDCGDDNPEGGHRKVSTQFECRQMHNEQLCIVSCGIILGRATFYGAEGPSSIHVHHSRRFILLALLLTHLFQLFWKHLFPTKASLPVACWYDNNFKMATMLAVDGDTYFKCIVPPVDIFHFKAKHKQLDDFCRFFCNPAHWIELIDEETGQWIFNLSAAEQVNLWFGGFRGITHLMRKER